MKGRRAKGRRAKGNRTKRNRAKKRSGLKRRLPKEWRKVENEQRGEGGKNVERSHNKRKHN